MSPDAKKDTALEAKPPIRGLALEKPLQFVGHGVWLLNCGDQSALTLRASMEPTVDSVPKG